MRRSLAQTETSSEAVWTVLSRHPADATQLVNCSTAVGQQPRNSCHQGAFLLAEQYKCRRRLMIAVDVDQCLGRAVKVVCRWTWKLAREFQHCVLYSSCRCSSVAHLIIMLSVFSWRHVECITLHGQQVSVFTACPPSELSRYFSLCGRLVMTVATL